MVLPDRKLRIAVLMGGASSERPISLTTGKMILEALDSEKYEVRGIDTADMLSLAAAAAPPALSSASDAGEREDIATDQPQTVAPSETKPARPDLVFIALHGKGGEDGTVQGMLEFLGIPYTGSGVLASALAMNKSMTKQLLQANGLPVIEAVRVHRSDALSESEMTSTVRAKLGFPVFVKPNAEGSTFGATPVHAPEELYTAVKKALQYDEAALIERYVRGVEITVGVLENEAGMPEVLPIVEVVPKSAYYDFESKYADGGSEHIIPARLPENLYRQAQDYALKCHLLLGCRGMSRTDMLIENEHLSILEINTIPGMTPTSLLPQAAAHAGIDFHALLERILAAALR